MNWDNRRHVAAWGRRHRDRTTDAERGTGSRWPTGRRPLATLAAIAMAGTAAFLSPNAIVEAQAQRIISLSSAKRTALVGVAVGKTEDVRLDAR